MLHFHSNSTTYYIHASYSNFFVSKHFSNIYPTFSFATKRHVHFSNPLIICHGFQTPGLNNIIPLHPCLVWTSRHYSHTHLYFSSQGKNKEFFSLILTHTSHLSVSLHISLIVQQIQFILTAAWPCQAKDS
jgi:hypothetical protein